MSEFDGDRNGTPDIELTQELLDRCQHQLLAEDTPQWLYLTRTRGIPAEAVRYISADLRAIDPPLPGFDRLARGVVSLLRGRDGMVTGLAIEAVGPAGEAIRGEDGRTFRRSYALKQNGQIEALFRAEATGSGALVAYMAEGRLLKPAAIAAVIGNPAVYGFGGINGLGRCLPPEPTVIVVEDARPADPAAAERHDAAMIAGCDRLVLGGKVVLRAGPPPCGGHCKDADEALTHHPLEEVRAWLISARPYSLSLDGRAREAARIKNPIAQAEAIARAISDLELRKIPGMIPAFRKAVAHYARPDWQEAGEDEAQPAVKDVLPWPYPVDGATVLDAAVELIRAYVNLSIEAAHAAALWAAHSHALNLSWFNPRLAICSPVKRCGKTTLVEILAGLVARAKPSSGVTPSVVFRVIDKYCPTYLIDEADGFLPSNEELRSVLNSGHTRTSAMIDRNVKDQDGNWQPASFTTWCPLVVAGIGRLPGTLDDRSIKIRLQRKPRAVKLARFRADRVAGINELGRKLARFVLDNQIAIQNADVDPPEELHDRAADNWRPLLNIAGAAGGHWPERARAAAKALEKADMDADDLCIQLLDDLRTRFLAEPAAREAILTNNAETAKAIKLFSAEALTWLLTQQERPWNECNRGRALTQRGIAAFLKPLDIETHKNVRRGDRTGKGFSLDEFLEPFAAYLPPLDSDVYANQSPHTAGHGVTGSQPSNSAGSGVTHNGSQPRTEEVRPADGEAVPDGRDPSCDSANATQKLTCDPVTHGPKNEGPDSRTHCNGEDDRSAWSTPSAPEAAPELAAEIRRRHWSRIKGADTHPRNERLS
jgi:uncharacterized protein DUF3631